TVLTDRFGIGLGIVLPYDRLPSLSMKIARSADDATSAAALLHGLPVSAWMYSPNSRSRVRRSAAARPSTSPRFGAGRRPHASAAATATSTARFTSTADPRATFVRTRSSIGLRFSNESPMTDDPPDATSASSIQ